MGRARQPAGITVAWRMQSMKIRGLKSVLALSCGLLSLAAAAGAQEEKAMNLKPFADADHVIYMPTNIAAKRVPSKATNISYHGGNIVVSARVVFIFWGSAFGSGGVSPTNATTPHAVPHPFGTPPPHKTLTTYKQRHSNISPPQLGAAHPL